MVNNKNKITGKKCQPVMSVTGLNDQGHNMLYVTKDNPIWMDVRSDVQANMQ